MEEFVFIFFLNAFYILFTFSDNVCCWKNDKRAIIETLPVELAPHCLSWKSKQIKLQFMGGREACLMLFKFVFAKSSRRHQGVKSSDQSFANLKRFALSIKTRFDCQNDL
jgi:hypothetical protein